MNKLDSMLMIGSTGANVGKTVLACRLIGKYKNTRPIVGIKVTSIEEKNGQCPRGGEGCGTCSSLEGNFSITEENDKTTGKDTARLLAAGASRVYWLCVLKAHIEEGFEALLDIIGQSAVSICESNTLRKVIEPGLFLIVHNEKLESWKSSARQVEKYADKVMVSSRDDFDFDIARIKLIDGKWVMQEDATAVILAGGESVRMGTDKTMLPFKGRTLIEFICEQLRHSFRQMLLSAGQVEKYEFLGVETVRDKVPGQGPLMGIASALEASTSDLNFIVACDIPNINMVFVRRMLEAAGEADMVIPVTGDGKYEPLFAVYRKSSLGAINKVLSSGRRKISEAFSECRVKYIELNDAEWFKNINTMTEYEEFQKRHSNNVR